MSLRTRLFLSHTTVIVVGLVVLSAALAVLLIDFQQRLMLRELNFFASTLVRVMRIAETTDNMDRAVERLAQTAQQQRYRILLIDSKGTVSLDNGFGADVTMTGRALSLSQRLNADSEATPSASRDTPVTGDFRDAQKRRWVYVALPVRPAQANTNWLAIARPAVGGPLITLLGESLTLPFVEAGLAALAVAAIIAALVARSIAKPIQKVAAGASAIAQGHYEQRVEPSGPSEVRELAEDFNRMAARVQSAQKMERDFVANVSHELKTPLTSIKGFAQAIQDGAAADPASAARIINDEAGRLARLVTSLLESARLETGETQMLLRGVSVNEVARACLFKLTPRAAAAGITLAERLGDVPAIQADGDRLAQVFTNLLDNAITHTERGGKVTVESATTAATKTRAPGVEFSVSDNGRGIPPDDLPRIFERFYQVDKARAQTDGANATGAGLGLAICKQIVEAHHGQISAQSVPGIGTRISVWLPSKQG
jgi:signal transduction histidine kinase